MPTLRSTFSGLHGLILCLHETTQRVKAGGENTLPEYITDDGELITPFDIRVGGVTVRLERITRSVRVGPDGSLLEWFPLNEDEQFLGWVVYDLFGRQTGEAINVASEDSAYISLGLRATVLLAILREPPARPWL